MKRKRSTLKKARGAVDKAAASVIKAGIMKPGGIVVKLGGQRPERWKPPEERNVTR